MELNIEWIRIEDANVLSKQLYFVGKVSEKGVVRTFCLANRVSGVWLLDYYLVVPFKITHICPIHKVSYETPSNLFAIDDMVETLSPINDYKKHSVGQIVGKFDSSRTWCIRMEDNFVLLLREDEFRYLHS